MKTERQLGKELGKSVPAESAICRCERTGHGKKLCLAGGGETGECQRLGEGPWTLRSVA